MQIVTLPADDQWFNLYTLSGFSAGESLVVTNKSSDTLYLAQQPTEPTEQSFPVAPLETVIVNGSNDPVWISGDRGPVVVQTSPASVTPFTGAVFPADMYTSDKNNFRRLKVDVGQTGFFEGREFRTFFEFNIPAGNVRTFKFNAPVDFILFEQSLTVDDGKVRFSAFSGATEIGTFNTMVPIFGKNIMTERLQPYYTPQVTINTTASTVALGSDITGGTLREVFRVVAATSTAQQQTVGGAPQSERGLAAGTFYLRIENIGNGAATGVYSLIWEERP